MPESEVEFLINRNEIVDLTGWHLESPPRQYQVYINKLRRVKNP